MKPTLEVVGNLSNGEPVDVAQGQGSPVLRGQVGENSACDSDLQIGVPGVVGACSYAASLAGPPLGGALFSLGHAVPFLFDGLTYLVSLLSVRAIRTPLEEPTTERPAQAIRADISEGLRHVLDSRFLRALLLIAAPLNFAVGVAVFAIVVVLRQAGHSSTTIGAATAVVGLSGLAGAVAAPRLQRRASFRALLVAAVAGLTVALAATAALAGRLAMVAPLAAGLFLAPAVNSSLFARLAATTPDNLQGRVYSTIINAATAVAALAPIIAGVVIEQLGGPAAIAFAAVVTLLALGTAVLSPGLDVWRQALLQP